MINAFVLSIAHFLLILFYFASFCLLSLVILYNLYYLITNKAKSVINLKNGTAAECLSINALKHHSKCVSFPLSDEMLDWCFFLSISVQTLTSPLKRSSGMSMKQFLYVFLIFHIHNAQFSLSLKRHFYEYIYISIYIYLYIYIYIYIYMYILGFLETDFAL